MITFCSCTLLTTKTNWQFFHQGHSVVVLVVLNAHVHSVIKNITFWLIKNII